MTFRSRVQRVFFPVLCIACAFASPCGSEQMPAWGWKAEEPDGETTYHVELNNVTVHFFQEEWEEFLELAHILK